MTGDHRDFLRKTNLKTPGNYIFSNSVYKKCTFSVGKNHNKWKQRMQKVNCWHKGVGFLLTLLVFTFFNFQWKSLIKQTRNIESFGDSFDCPSNKKQFGTIVSLELGKPELFLDMGTALAFLNLLSHRRGMFALGRLLSRDPAGPADQHTAVHICV